LLPSSAEAHSALGEALNNVNALEPARGEFEKAVQLNPNMAQAQVNLGMVLAQTGPLASAAEHLDRALAMLGKQPEAALAHYLRAKVHTDLSEVEQASTDLKEAVRLRPDFAEAWSDLGQARKTLLDSTGALAAFKRAVLLSPSDPVALTRLGAEYLHQGQVKLAIVHLEKAYSIDPKDQTTLNSLQTALRQDGQVTQARKIKEKLAEVLRARDITTQNELNAARINSDGVALEKAGDLRGAVEKYRAALDLDPSHVEVRVNLAVALLKLGQWKQGLTELREAMRQAPHDPVLKAAWDDAIRQAPPGSWTEPKPPRP
jgi:tetratricopeptide (TPR) repeat protein